MPTPTKGRSALTIARLTVAIWLLLLWLGRGGQVRVHLGAQLHRLYCHTDRGHHGRSSSSQHDPDPNPSPNPNQVEFSQHNNQQHNNLGGDSEDDLGDSAGDEEEGEEEEGEEEDDDF